MEGVFLAGKLIVYKELKTRVAGWRRHQFSFDIFLHGNLFVFYFIGFEGFLTENPKAQCKW